MSEHVHDRFLKRLREVRMGLWFCKTGTNGHEYLGLEPAETEVKAALKQGPGKSVASGASRGGKPFYCRSSGIAEPEQLGGLVERLASGVVERFAKLAIAAHRLDVHQQGVASRDQQGHEREAWRVGVEHRREQVTLEVVYADGRDTPGISETMRKRRPNEQCSGETWALRIGDAVYSAGPSSQKQVAYEW